MLLVTKLPCSKYYIPKRDYVTHQTQTVMLGIPEIVVDIKKTTNGRRICLLIVFLLDTNK